ncbi:MAG: hypothetical protein Q4E62_07030 [Sutterellaceae bacterium]|nr:hypothetical protein [Sutterellaceae bacterium]
MYNFLLAFVLCGAVVVIGEIVSTLSKAWIPSVFVSAVVILIGYWTFLPHDLVKDSFLIPFGASLCIFILITHLGTVISLEQLIQQWRTVVVCLSGLFGMCLAAYFIAPLFMDRTLMITGLPPLTGGIVAATMMQSAATKAGLTVAAVFAISMYCIQGFAGYPLTAYCLKKEGERLLKEYRAGNMKLSEEELKSVGSVLKLPETDNQRRLLLQIPEKWNNPVLILTKLGLVAWLASQVGAFTGISGAIWALVLGVIFCRLGFLDVNALVKANSFQIMMFALMMFIYDGLKDCTPEMLGDIIMPMITLIVIGVIGMFVASWIIAKILKMSFYLAFANGLTAFYGFPFDQILTVNTCNSLTDKEDEHAFLMSKMFPSMIVGGFVTVTITSVFIAGIFAKML